jgi:predicted Na+-dependent transporter
MKTLIAVGVPAMTFILLLVVGMTLTREDFARLRHRRAVVLLGLFAPLLLLPPLASGSRGCSRRRPRSPRVCC